MAIFGRGGRTHQSYQATILTMGQYGPTAPAPVAHQVLVMRAPFAPRPPLPHSLTGGLIRTTPITPPIAKTVAAQDAQAAALSARRPLFRPIQNRLIAYTALQPPVGRLTLYGEGVSQTAAYLARVKHPQPLILSVNFNLEPPGAALLWIIRT